MQTPVPEPDGSKLPDAPTGCIERAQRSAAPHGNDGRRPMGGPDPTAIGPLD